MEKIGQPDEIYRRIDCTLVVNEENVCKNCIKLKKTIQQIQRRILEKVNTKTTYASKEILIEKVNNQQKVIKEQNELIANLKDRLHKKIKNEEEEV